MKATGELLRSRLAFTLMLGLFTMGVTTVFGQTSAFNSIQERLYVEYENEHFASKAMVSNYTTVDNVTMYTAEYSNSAKSLEALLIVELENDIEIEEWMMEPFENNVKERVAQSEFNELLTAETEEELALENWMVDLSSW